MPPSTSGLKYYYCLRPCLVDPAHQRRSSSGLTYELYTKLAWRSNKFDKIRNHVPQCSSGDILGPRSTFRLDNCAQVHKLKLQQENYSRSLELRRWCKENRQHCYIPEWLLKQWGRRSARSSAISNSGSGVQSFMKCDVAQVCPVWAPPGGLRLG